MHLLALLVATVLASNFVAPNDPISEMSLSPSAITTLQLTGTLPAITITVTGNAPSGDEVWELGTQADGEGENVDISDLVEEHAAGHPKYVFTAVDGDPALDAIIALGVPSKLFILITDTGIDPPVAAELAITPVGEAVPDVIFAYQTNADIEIKITNSTWFNSEISYAICPVAPTLATAFDATLKGKKNAVSNVLTITIPQAKIAGLIGAMEDDHIYIYAGAGATDDKAAENAPVPIAYKAPGFTHDKSAGVLISKTKAAMTIVLTRDGGEAWPTAANGFKAIVSRDPAGVNNKAEFTITATASAATISMTAAHWEAIGVPATGGQVFIFAAPGTETTAETTPAVFNVIPDFTVELAEVEFDEDKIEDLEIITNDATWANIRVKFSTTKLAGPPYEAAGFGQTANLTKSTATYTIDEVDLSDQTLPPGGNLYVYVGLPNTATPPVFVYTLDPVAIPITTEFTLTTAAVKDSDKTITSIVFAPVSEITVEGTNQVTLYFTQEKTATPEDIPATAVAPWATDAYKLSTYTIPPAWRLGSVIYVYVSYEADDTGNTVTTFFDQVGEIAVTEDNGVVRFTLSIDDIVAADIATTADITITQKLGKPWTAPVKARVTLDSSSAAAFVSPALTGTGDVYTLEFDEDLLAYLEDAADGDTIKIEISHNNGAFYAIGANIDVIDASGPSFTLDITQIAQEDMGAITIEVTPVPSSAFGEEDILIGFTVAAEFATPTVTLAVEQNEDEEWIATGSISTLPVTAQTTTIYAWIKIGEEWLTTISVPLTYVPTPPAQFTITPAKATEGKLAKADSDEYTIAIKTGVEKPAKATKSKVVFTAGAKTLTVEFAPTGDSPAHTWVIAAGECDFASLNIATFPTVGKVAFHPDKDGAALGPAIPFTFEAAATPGGAAMGVSPLLSLLAALVFLFVKLF